MFWAAALLGTGGLLHGSGSLQDMAILLLTSLPWSGCAAAHPPVPVLNSAGSVTSSGNPVLSCGLKFSEIRPGLQELKSGMCNVMQLASLIIVGAISRMHNYLNCRQNNH